MRLQQKDTAGEHDDAETDPEIFCTASLSTAGLIEILAHKNSAIKLSS